MPMLIRLLVGSGGFSSKRTTRPSPSVTIVPKRCASAMVACQDQQRIGFPVGPGWQVLVHGVGGAAVPVGAFAAQIGLQQAYAAAHAVEVPWPTDADVVVQAVGSVLREDRDAIDAGVDAVRQGEVDDAVLACEGNGWLRALRREHTQPFALATGEDDRHDTAHRRLKCNPAVCLILRRAFEGAASS